MYNTKRTLLIGFIVTVLIAVIVVFKVSHTYPEYEAESWKSCSKTFNTTVDMLDAVYKSNPMIARELEEEEGVSYNILKYKDDKIISSQKSSYQSNFNLNPDIINNLNEMNQFFYESGGNLDSIGFGRNGRITFMSDWNFAVVYSPNCSPSYYHHIGNVLEFDIYELEESWYLLEYDSESVTR